MDDWNTTSKNDSICDHLNVTSTTRFFGCCNKPSWFGWSATWMVFVLALMINLLKLTSTKRFYIIPHPFISTTWNQNLLQFYITKVQLQPALEFWTSSMLSYIATPQSPVLPACPQQQSRGDNHCEEARHKCIEWHLQWIPEQHHHGLQPPAPWDYEVMPLLPILGSTHVGKSNKDDPNKLNDYLYLAISCLSHFLTLNVGSSKVSAVCSINAPSYKVRSSLQSASPILRHPIPSFSAH